MSRFLNENEMYRAVARKDPSYDAVFFVAVRTTGIFCRPSCPAKKPLPRNVEYFATVRDAMFAGYRPCKRCRPLEADGRPPAWVSQLLEQLEGNPEARMRDRDLRGLCIDPARARKFFMSHYGMTFQGYQRARRLGGALAAIRTGRPVSRAALDAGYESESGFRDAFTRTFRNTPGSGALKGCICSTILESPVGPLLLGAKEGALCLLEFCDRRSLEKQVSVLQRRLGCAVVPGDNEMLRRTRRELKEYFDGKRRKFDVPLEYPGTEFQHSVWGELRKIPYGKTISYEELARRVGRPGAQRAVGTANGANRIAIVIPCHRVVNKNGELGGYGGGLWRKKLLLGLEQGGADSSHLFPNRTIRANRRSAEA